MSGTFGGLPIELLPSIIEHADTETVKSCALTCKAFLNPARAILHRTVFIYDEIVDTLADIYILPELARWVREVHLTGYGGDDPSHWITNEERESRVLLILSSFSAQLIKVLELHVVSLDRLSSRMMGALLQFQGIVEFGLSGVSASLPTTVYSIVLKFPLISRLSLHRVRFDEEPPATSPPIVTVPAEFPNLTSISIIETNEYLLNLLVRSRYPRLKRLKLLELNLAQTNLFHAFLQSVGQSLTTVEISLIDIPDEVTNDELDRLRNDMSLSLHPQLRQLHIWGLNIAHIVDVSWPFYMLQSINDPHLEEVWIQFFPEPNTLSNFNWDLLDTMFTSPRFRATRLHLRAGILKMPTNPSQEDIDLYFPDRKTLRRLLRAMLYRSGRRARIHTWSMPVTFANDTDGEDAAMEDDGDGDEDEDEDEDEEVDEDEESIESDDSMSGESGESYELMDTDRD